MTLPTPVVSNTSPLLNLAIIDHLDILRQQFGKVVVPEAAHRELRLDTNWKGAVVLRQAFGEGWLEMRPVHNAAFVTALRGELDRGEAEALVLATEMDVGCVLLDEREARRVARRLEIPVTGVLGILSRARLQGTISSLSDVISRLREEAGFWIAPALEKDILRQVGE